MNKPRTPAEIFADLDPVIIEDFDGNSERTAITVRTAALHDLMNAYAIHRIASQ